MKIDAVSQMRVEYQNAIVHQARVQQAQRIREEVENTQNDLEDAVKSAICPFLVLEVRRDHLIEDTLNQIHLKVRAKQSVISCIVEPRPTDTRLIRTPVFDGMFIRSDVICDQHVTSTGQKKSESPTGIEPMTLRTRFITRFNTILLLKNRGKIA